MQSGYIVSTSNYFFVYLISIAILYLIGQRTQRAQWASETQQDSNYRRILEQGVTLQSEEESRHAES